MTPDPPSTLREAGRRLWTAILTDFDLDDDQHALRLMETACQHADAAAVLQSAIDKDGAVFKDRFDNPRVHPAVQQLRGERSAMVAVLGKLGFDLEPVKPIGRPPGKR